MDVAEVPRAPPPPALGQDNFRETAEDGPIIQQVAKYLSYEELKRSRLVCKAWNTAILPHPSFTQGRVTFSQAWIFRNVNRQLPQRLPRWTNAKLVRIGLGRTAFIQRYWRPQFYAIVRVLELENISTRCLTLCKAVNALPVLQDLTLTKIRFKMARNEVEFFQAGGFNQPNARNGLVVPRYHYCVHQLLPPEIRVLDDTRTIRSIKISEVPVLPNCLLHLLRRRCNTVLESFEYSGNPLAMRIRAVCSPFLHIQETHIRTMLVDNVGTIRKLTWKKNSSGNRFISMLSIPELRNMRLTDITLIPPKVLGTDPDVNIWNTYAILLREPRHRPPESLLRKLHIGLCGQYTMDEVQQIISRMVQLEDLLLRFNRLVANVGFRIDFRPFLHLKSLELVQEAMHPMEERHPLVLTTVRDNMLPHTLTALALNVHQSMPQDNLVGLLGPQGEPRNHGNLTKLVLGELAQTNFDDNSVQRIIEGLPLLEELEIKDAVRVTDKGFTGITLKTVQTLIKARSFTLLFGQGTHRQTPGTRNLSELRHLRSLSLSGCRQLSDVTIAVGINLPFLRELDLSYLSNVTDFGILHLTKLNPGLEKLVLKYTNKVSHFGINQLVKDSPSLVSVRISVSVFKRKFRGIRYPRLFERYGRDNHIVKIE